jgi:hypothetical protein
VAAHPSYLWWTLHTSPTFTGNVAYGALSSAATLPAHVDRVQVGVRHTGTAGTLSVRAFAQRASDSVWIPLGSAMTVTTTDVANSAYYELPPGGLYEAIGYTVSGWASGAGLQVVALARGQADA